MTAAGGLTSAVRADVTLSAAVDHDARRGLVERTAAPALDGIDTIEVLANLPGSTLLVRLLRGQVPADLTVDRVRVLGGVRPDPRVNPVRVQWAYPALAVAHDGDLPAGVTPADRALVDGMIDPSDRAGVLVVRTSSSGDWSTYVFMLLGPGGVGVPAGFDEPLAQAPFRFTVDCPSDLDCRRELECPPVGAPSPVLDYLARDYDALRTRLLDRLSSLLPGWADRNPADPAVTLVELFSATGDRGPAGGLAGRGRGGGVPGYGPAEDLGAPARPAAGLPRPRGLLRADLAGVHDHRRVHPAGRHPRG